MAATAVMVWAATAAMAWAPSRSSQQPSFLGISKMVDLLCNFGADPEEAVEIAVCMVNDRIRRHSSSDHKA